MCFWSAREDLNLRPPTPHDGYCKPKYLFKLSVSTSVATVGNDSNLLIVFYVQIMPDDFVMQLHRF